MKILRYFYSGRTIGYHVFQLIKENDLLIWQLLHIDDDQPDHLIELDSLKQCNAVFDEEGYYLGREFKGL